MRTPAHGPWATVVTLAGLMAVSLGCTVSSIGLALVPVCGELGCAATAADLALSAFVAMMTISMPVAGWLSARVGPRGAIALGGLLAALGYAVAASSGSTAAFIAAVALTGSGIGLGTYVPCVLIAAACVPDRPSTAIGVLLAGAAIGAIAFPLIADWAFSALGWRAVLRVAALLLAGLPTALLFALPRPAVAAQRRGHGSTVECPGRRALFGATYWLLTIATAAISLAAMTAYFIVVPHLIDAGFPQSSATAIFASLGAASFFGYLATGAIADRIGSKPALIMTLAGSLFGLLALCAADRSVAGMVAAGTFALMWGATFNGSNQLVPVLIAELFQGEDIGLLLGINQMVAGLISAIGPLMSGRLHESFNSYAPALGSAAAIILFAMLPVATLASPRK